MDTTEELRKLNTIIVPATENFKKDLIEVTVWIEVDREAFEEMITEGIFGNNRKPLSFKDVVYQIQSNLRELKNTKYSHTKLPYWANAIYDAEVKEDKGIK